MRLAQLWTSLQQTGVSVQRLGISLMPHRTSQATRQRLAAAQGCDRIRPGAVPLPPRRLRGAARLSLSIGAGEVIGIVGPLRLRQKHPDPPCCSGSTPPSAGGCWWTAWTWPWPTCRLASAIGVVLQDNMLFHRSIRENIALADRARPWKR